MSAGAFHVVLVLLHIVLVTVWFGLGLRLQFQARALGEAAPGAGGVGASGPTGFAEMLRSAGSRTVQGMTVTIIVFYAVAVANFFVGGGFAAYPPPYHIALTLGLVLVLVQVLLIQPAWARFAGGDADARKRVAMGVGIGHALWLVLLVLMFFGPKWAGVWAI